MGKSKSCLVAMLFVRRHCFTTRLASIGLLLWKSPAILRALAKLREAFKEAVQRRMASDRQEHQEDLLIATTLDVRYAMCS
jgi:hypothetical protein